MVEWRAQGILQKCLLQLRTALNFEFKADPARRTAITSNHYVVSSIKYKLVLRIKWILNDVGWITQILNETLAVINV